MSEARVVGLHADRLQVEAAVDVSGGHSFRSYTHDGDGEPKTVKLESGKTWLEFRGEPYQFDGVDYFPHHDGRESYLDADVDLLHPDGTHPEYPHPLNGEKGLPLRKFVSMLEAGDLTPIEEPEP